MNYKKLHPTILLMTLFCLLTINKSNAQSATVIEPGPEHYASKSSSIGNRATQISPIKNVTTGNSGQLNQAFNLSRSNSEITASPAVNCYIPPDGTYTNFPGNDDGSVGPIALPFTFSLYGVNYNSVYINNNGNLTFTGPSAVYDPAGFPFNVPMVAPFWADVDTRVGNTVKYKVNPTNLIVTWPGVGYYNQKTNLLNTFQVIITNGNDSLIGLGSNVAFYYGDMQWTTGEVPSNGGVNGFGGLPATAGINQGDGINYIQIGRFNANNGTYIGPLSGTSGINYLDFGCFPLTAGSLTNLPPSVSGLPANNTLNIACGETGTINLTALPPEVGQNVLVAIDTGSLCNATVTSSSGPSSNAIVSILGAACNEGSHNVSFYFADNFNPTASTTVNITVVVGSAPVISCPSDITVSNTPGQCGAIVNYPAATATGTSPTITYSIASGSFFPVGTTTVTATATNSCGSQSCDFTVTVNDTQLPNVITQNVTVNLDANGTAQVTAAQINNGSTDNCSIASMSLSKTNFDCSDLNLSIGNCQMDANYIDSATNANSGPNGQTFTCLTSGLLSKIDVISYNPAQLRLRNYVSEDLATAFTGAILATSNSADGAANFPGFTSFTFATPPFLTAGTKYIFEVVGSGTVYHHITGTYAGGTAVSPTNPGAVRDIPFKTYICSAGTVVTLTVTDVNNNSNTENAFVTVVDNIAPVITCPPTANVIANNTGCTYSGSIGTATATDNCGSPTISGPVPAGPYPVGTTVVTWTATDASGNSATCTQSVVVVTSVPAVTANNVSGCFGTAIALSGTPAGGTWSIANPYTGPSTTYTHSYTDGNGCSATSASATVTTHKLDYANLQWPPNAAICPGGSFTTYGQVYEGGLTDVAPYITGQAPNIQAWVGISPEGSNSNPNTWTNWTPAVLNASAISNNDEYMANIGNLLTPGTYYYTFRYSYMGCGYQYGGFGGSGVWDGSSSVSGVLTIKTLDYVNLQWPGSGSICPGGSMTAYGQVYEGGLTDVGANIPGQAPGIQAWIGISPVGSNSNPNTWSNWTPATWNSDHISNNDEYKATFGSSLAPGTYYYTFRYSLDGCAYQYGGFNSGGSSFWNGVNYVSGVLTVNPLPTVTAADVSGCAGTAIALSGTPAGGSWSVANPYTGPSTTYTHTYTDGNGCTNTSAPANITVNPLPIPVITANGPTTFCDGGSVTLTADFPYPSSNTTFMNSPSGGGTPVDCKCPAGYVAVGYTGYTGSWMDKIQLACKKLNSNGTLNPNIVYTSALGIGGGGGPNGPYLLTGDKVLVGGRADNGCCGYLSRFEGYGQSINYIQANGNNSSSPTSAGAFGPAGSSLGTQYVPNGNVVVGIKGWLNGFVSGLSLIYAPINQVMNTSYSWSNGSTDGAITVATAGNYSVTATSAFGCSATVSQTVTVNPQPVAVSPTTIAICIGGSTTLQVSGASGYNWSPATGLNQTTGDTVTASPTVTTVYTITATDPGSCSTTITVVVNPLPTPVISVTGPTTFCQGGSTILTAGPSNPNIWNAGSLTFVKTVAGQTDNITANTHLTRGNSFPLYNAITEASAPAGNCNWTPGNTEWAYGNIADWNTLSYQYLWPMIGCYPPGMVNQPMVVHLISENIYFQLTFTFWQAGGGNYTYTRTTQAAAYAGQSWSSGQTTPSISVNTSGNYTATVTDNNGCIATTAATTITVDPTSVGGAVSGGTSPICTGFAPGTLTLSGHTGAVLQWESSSDDVTWYPIANTSDTHSPGVLLVTTKFRAVVQSGTCLIVYSDPLTITVYQEYPFYADNDSDGYGAGPSVLLCSINATTVPAGYSLDNTDCDDSKDDRHQTYPFYVDADGDTYGAAGSTAVQLCAINASTPPLPNYSVNALDCNDAVFAIHPGVYDIPYDNIDNNCDGSLFDGHSPIVVYVLSPSCGGINHGLNNTINCTEIDLGEGYVIGYRFKVTNLVTGEIAYVDTVQHHFKLTDTSIYSYGTPYSIQAAAIINGEVQPFNGPICTLTTTTVATTKVIATQCGSTLIFMTSTINATAVNQALAYRFRVSRADAPGVYYLSPERTSPNFNLTMLTVPAGFLTYATEYKVDVQIKIKLANLIAWSQFGQACSIFTPPMPETSLVASQCEMTATSNTQVINTTPFTGATLYRFRLTLYNLIGDLVYSQYVDTPNPYFTLSMFSGLLPGNTYVVSVTMQLYGTFVDYGKDCSVTTPLVAKTTMTLPFKAIAHPNPFAENFIIDVTTSIQEMVSLKVYDMLGRLVEQREVKRSDLENSPFGDRYPSGVYNIIVTQGEEVRTVRVVKR
ncbi:nidogen-like domain-containing protein [Flavobacterium sangjuense]|uniref:HYR domain-containing protein n=1 Tax=Flavobacterium sangjuense TaxID=2518177 RepID=A0A4P7PWE3_9FLAO|nr:nidogen-like domain-containing protein [Flavobacterium sangjuense]QBZ98730.1 hypothetical protein GS03_02240 [Flavobacterium sangjuense]